MYVCGAGQILQWRPFFFSPSFADNIASKYSNLLSPSKYSGAGWLPLLPPRHKAVGQS